MKIISYLWLLIQRKGKRDNFEPREKFKDSSDYITGEYKAMVEEGEFLVRTKQVVFGGLELKILRKRSNNPASVSPQLPGKNPPR